MSDIDYVIEYVHNVPRDDRHLLTTENKTIACQLKS